MQPNYTSVIMLLDIDGTLVDTDAHLSNSIATLFKKYGVAFEPREFFEPKHFPIPNEQGMMEDKTTMLFGAAWEHTYYYLKSQNPSHDPGVEHFRNEIIEYVTSHHDAILVRQDVIDTVLAIKDKCEVDGIGFTVIAVTNGARKEALANLKLAENAGLTVDGLVSADDVVRRKPYPDPYLLGHKMALDVLFKNSFDATLPLTIALEDSPPGATSAVAAGEACDLTCFYIPTTRRPLLLPEFSNDELARFEVEQDIRTLHLKISTMLDGRGHTRHKLARPSAAP